VERGNYAESLRLETDAPWLHVPPAALAGPAGARITVAVDWERLGASTAAEHLAAVRIFNTDDGALRAVIPVTIMVPRALSAETVAVAAGGIELTQSWRPRPAMYDETCWQCIAFAGK
jgi:hypothetical protein